MGLLADRQFGIAGLERELAVGHAHEPDDHAQEGGFSRAIAAADRQKLAGGDGKAHAGEDFATAASAGQVGGREPHQSAPGRRANSAPVCQQLPDGSVMRWMIADHSLLNWHKS